MNINIIFWCSFFVIFSLNQYNFCAQQAVKIEKNPDIAKSDNRALGAIIAVRVNTPYLPYVSAISLDSFGRVWHNSRADLWWCKVNNIVFVKHPSGNIGAVRFDREFYILDTVLSEWKFVCYLNTANS